MTALTIATWNINSVRLREEQAARFAESRDVDVLCLQEIKCVDDKFPKGALKKSGYEYFAVNGQKAHHGVAIASRLPLERLEGPNHCSAGQARCVAVKVGGLELHNYYAPSGGDTPDPEANDKFAHKLDFWRRVHAWGASERARLDAEPVLIVGDLNIAPGQYDVTEHRGNLKNVGHTPLETETMTAAREAGGFTDLARTFTPEPALINTWWSYRVKEWSPQARGWRLDYLWASGGLRSRALAGGPDSLKVHHATRSWGQPSDHVPVSLTLKPE